MNFWEQHHQHPPRAVIFRQPDRRDTHVCLWSALEYHDDNILWNFGETRQRWFHMNVPLRSATRNNETLCGI